MDLLKLLEVAKSAAEDASKNILEIYESGDFSIEAKEDDSPLTKADRASHIAITKHLIHTGIPILSEEGGNVPYEERNNWKHFWMIDPLDGTKEFIKKNGEFTVNIALISDNAPILGVVMVPVQGKLYSAIKGKKAHLTVEGETKELKANNIDLSDSGLKVVASRSHLNDETQVFLDSLENPEIVSMGSSLKLLAIADGSADVYPRFAPTMEWDTAAAQIIVEESGGKVMQKGSELPVRYNKENLLNPFFLVTAKESE